MPLALKRLTLLAVPGRHRTRALAPPPSLAPNLLSPRQVTNGEPKSAVDASAQSGDATCTPRLGGLWSNCDELWEEEGGVPKPLLQRGITPAMWKSWPNRHKLRSKAKKSLSSLEDEESVWTKIADRMHRRRHGGVDVLPLPLPVSGPEAEEAAELQAAPPLETEVR